jgi:hypothetical protein
VCESSLIVVRLCLGFRESCRIDELLELRVLRESGIFVA